MHRRLRGVTRQEALKTITGKVCYQCDFWLRASGLGGPRSQGATALLSGILLQIMISSWKLSFVFAFVPQRLAAKGAHLRYGYSHCEPGRWVGPDQQVTEEDYFIWMGANDMANMAARETQNQKRMFGITPAQSAQPVDANRLVGEKRRCLIKMGTQTDNVETPPVSSHTAIIGPIAANIAFVMEITLVPLLLSAIQLQFNLSIGDLAWVFNAYGIAVACGVLLGGLVRRRFQHKESFRIWCRLFRCRIVGGSRGG